jgi:hypothetical protein
VKIYHPVQIETVIKDSIGSRDFGNSGDTILNFFPGALILVAILYPGKDVVDTGNAVCWDEFRNSTALVILRKSITYNMYL